jgi:predicted HD phosphohydrolase
MKVLKRNGNISVSSICLTSLICPKRILSMLKQAESLTLGFGTDQLHHALQTATMARRAGAEDEMILISLIHDIGKVINVPNHGQIAGRND